MDVHQHLHHPPNEKRTWKLYALDFFMLFLAVSAGFFAENLRAHFEDEHQAKQYIQSFYDDLKTDTGRISFNINFDEQKIEGLSNLSNCYDSVSKNVKSTSCMLDIIKSTTINRPFLITDRTLKQLDNAGGFRLLDEEDADSILKYEKRFDQFQDFQTTLFQEAQDKVRSTYNELINFNATAQMFKREPGQTLLTFHKQVSAPLLFLDDKVLLNKYFNELWLYDRATVAQQNLLRELNKNQIRLIEFFRAKYHFQ